MRNTFSGQKIFPALLIALIASLTAMRIYAIHNRFFVGDEWQHLHMSWLISQGKIPYVDFYEHHTPLLHYISAPLFHWFKDSTAVLFAARWFMFLLTAGTFASLYWLIRNFNSRSVAWLALLLLALTAGFARHSMEFRTDVLLMFLWVLSFACLIRSIREEKRIWTACAGLLLGMAFLTTPKALFLCMAIAALLLFGFFIKTGQSKENIFRTISWLFITFCIPVLISLLYFSLMHKDGLISFYNAIIIDNFTMSVQEGAKRFLPWRALAGSISENTGLWAAALAGICHSALKWRLSEERDLAAIAPVIAALMVFISLFISPRPWGYSLLVLYPFLAWFAAIYLTVIYKKLLEKDRYVLLILLILFTAIPPMVTIAGETGHWQDQISRRKDHKAGGGHAARSLWSRYFWGNLKYTGSNREQLLDLQWVLENTSQDDAVFGIINRAVMRPDIDRYWAKMSSRNPDITGSLIYSNCRVIMFDYNNQYKNKELLPGKARTFINRHYLRSEDRPMILVSGVYVPPKKKRKGAVNLATTDSYRIGSADAECRVNSRKNGQTLRLESGKNRLKVRNCPSGFRLISEPRAEATDN